MSSGTARYLASRLVTASCVVLGAMLLLFTLSAVVPGDPAVTLLGPQATPAYAARFIAEMGLDQPLHVRLARFLSNVLVGNLGTDVVSGRSVASLVWAVLPYTLILTVAAIGLAVLVGVPLGIYAATHRGSPADHALAFVSVAFIAIPQFVLAVGLLLVFSIWLDWLPVLGASRTGGLADEARRMILPTLALAAGWIGFIARLVRASMLETLGENFIRTSRGFGLSERLITWKYALKNACIPTIAVLGLGIGRLLGGAVLVEIVFARPGLGRLIYDAIAVRNYPVVQGAVLVVVVLFVAVNLVVDLSYSAIDPRIRRSRDGEAGVMEMLTGLLDVLRRVAGTFGGAVGLGMVAIVVGAAILAPLVATHDPDQLDLMHRFAGPSLTHWLGTDHLGRDMYSRLVHGARVALGVAVVAIAIALVVGTPLGILAASLPTRSERLVLILFDVIASFPSLILALAFVAIFGPSTRMVVTIVAVTLIPHFGRVARAQVLAVRSAPYLEAERLLGASATRIVLAHILPNIAAPLLVLASMDIPVVITIEAGLSFLGLGVKPPLASWGTLIQDGYQHLSDSAIPVVVSAVALGLATLGFTLLGEALRDAVDPRLQQHG